MIQQDNQRNINDVIAYIFIKNLIKPVTKTKAYSIGLVDEHGRIKREPETDVEKEALSSIDVIIFKLKRLLGSRITELNKFIYLNAWDDKPQQYLMVKGGLSQHRVKQTSNELWRLRESVEEDMPSNVVKAYAKKYNKSVDSVEKIWNKIKEGLLSSGHKESDDNFWAIVNSSTQKALEESSNELVGSKWADAPYEEGKEIIGTEIKTKNYDKMKKYLKNLLKKEDAAITVASSGLADGVPEGGAGKGTYAPKMGATIKRIKKKRRTRL